MKKANKIIWGVVLVAAGILVALNSFGFPINIFFDGWWTLFIIVPSVIGLITDRDKTGNIIGIAVGVLLLLCSQNILDFDIFWKLIIPFIIIRIGLKLIFGNKAEKLISDKKENNTEIKSGFAAFSGQDLNFEGEVFEGCELNAIFGGIECDLRNAVIEKDCAVKASAIFGGIDILVPDNVNVKVDSVSIFGGVSNKTAAKKDAPTIYVSGTCLFGGVDIK